MPEATEQVADILGSFSFRADDILRSKFSFEVSQVLPISSCLPPKLAIGQASPVAKSSNLPQIRPPAFSPLVSLKHMRPFEHSEKRLFRPRQLSAPWPRLDAKPIESPCSQQKASKAQLPPPSQVLHPTSLYVWDSWERPKFTRAPGCLTVSDKKPDAFKDEQLQWVNPYLPPPPPVLYYDVHHGQYIAGSGYHTIGRCSQCVDQRHRSRRHQYHHHHRRKSIGHNSTRDASRSASRMSDYAPGSLIDFPAPQFEYQLREEFQNQQQQPPLYHTDRNNDQVSSNKNVYLVSSGTDDTPMQLVDTLSSRKQFNCTNALNNFNAHFAETSPLVDNSSTMAVSYPINSPGGKLPYTSDAERSPTRQVIKMNSGKWKNGPFPPRDNCPDKTTSISIIPGKVDTDLNSAEKRLSVKDLVNKFSQYANQASRPQTRSRMAVAYHTTTHGSVGAEVDTEEVMR